MGSSKKTLTVEKEPHLCNISYSSFINPSNDVCLRQLVETRKIPNSIISIQKDNVYDGKKKVEDGEIDIFGAEKYFNGEIDEETIDQQCVKTPHLSLTKVTIETRSPSVHSQSSWNSQRALLQSGRKSPIHNTNAKWRHGKCFFPTLTCSSCCDKNSIVVEENKSEIFSDRNLRDIVNLDQTEKSFINPRMEKMQMKKIEDFKTELKTEDCFTFPIMNPKPENFETKQFSQEDKDEKKMKSLEVFAPPIFTSDINSKREEIDHHPPSSTGIFNGFESDSSSDLFEITSFSTINNSNPYLLRQASNVSSCVTPVYAPSEASIEWSVVTASATDFSFVPDSDNKKASKTTRNGKGKEVEKRRLGILTGCKSQKAITVAEDTYKTHGKVVSNTRGISKIRVPKAEATTNEITERKATTGGEYIMENNQFLRFDMKMGRNGGIPSSLLRSNSGRA